MTLVEFEVEVPRRICDRKRATVSSSERDFDDGMLKKETYLG